MCNRFVQKGRMVKPGGKAIIFLRGPGGLMPVELDRKGHPLLAMEGVYSGAAQSETVERKWIRAQHAVEVLIPHVTSFGDWHVALDKQLDHDLPAGSALAGVLLPEVERKDGTGPYRLLKVQTRAATPEEEERIGNDRMAVVVPWLDAPEIPELPADPPRELKPGRAKKAEAEEPKPDGGQMELF
jgi:hypothetical protein